jgi:hypothetical protein
MDERLYLKILELLRQPGTTSVGKEMILHLRKTQPPYISILVAMLAYEVDRKNWGDGLAGTTRTFLQMDTYRGGCLHGIKLLQSNTLHDVDSAESLCNWLSKQGFKSNEDEEVKREYLLLFFRRLRKLEYPGDAINDYLWDLEENDSYTLGIYLPKYSITKKEIEDDYYD